MRCWRAHLNLASLILALVRDMIYVIVRGSATPTDTIASKLTRNATPDVITAINVNQIMIRPTITTC